MNRKGIPLANLELAAVGAMFARGKLGGPSGLEVAGPLGHDRHLANGKLTMV